MHSGREPEPSDEELDEAIARELAAIQEVLAVRGVSLEDPDLWVEALGVESEVLTTIRAEAEAPGSMHPVDRSARPWMITAVAAIAALIVALGLLVVNNRDPAADWSVELAATDAAPAATATVLGWNRDAGTYLTLDVDGLDPAPDGFVYELWFSNKDRHISAGTFARATDLEMLVGIRRGDFPRIWITLEPLDDDPSPGLTVLDTEV